MQTNVSIVVPAFNEERLLSASLHSILAAATAFHTLGWTWELIVCDNNSTDRTAEIARTAGARVVFEPINQIGRARNSGAAHAVGDWLIFIDADSYPTAALFADVARTIQDGRCLAGGSTLRFETHSPGSAFGIGIWNTISRITRCAAGSFIFCEAAAFQQIGGFNQDLFASEEIDLFRRLKQVAKVQHKQIVILHRHPMTTSARKLQYFSRRDHLRFAVKVMRSRGRVLRNIHDCYEWWYDGRR